MAPTRVKRAFRYRFYPTEVQVAELPRTFGCVRKVSTVTVSRDSAGRWFVSMLCEDNPAILGPTESAIGIDAGITALVTLSTGEKIANPRHEQRDRARLAKAQRALSRKAPGDGTNRAKARCRVARVHARIADGRNLVVVDRYFPSSKLCSDCGTRRERIPLHVRAWRCGCGATHDRDVNAAKNILAAGLAVTACGDDVRPQRNTPGGQSSVKQEVVPTAALGAAAQS